MKRTITIREMTQELLGVMSQRELAKKVGISQPGISAIASGSTKRPSYEVGHAIATQYGRLLSRKGKRR